MTWRNVALFSAFQYSFSSFHSTADLLTVVADRIIRVFNRFGATRAVALNNTRLLTEFGTFVFFISLSLVEF